MYEKIKIVWEETPKEWCAVRGIGELYGWGKTPSLALDDLLEQEMNNETE